MRNSITVAERACCCQLSMKYTRNGTKVSAKASCETELKPRVTRSVTGLVGCTLTMLLSSVTERSGFNDSARSRNVMTLERMRSEYLGRTSTNVAAWL